MRAAFRLLRFLRRCDDPGQRKFARRLAPRHRCMRSEKDRNAGNAIVEVWTQAYELENLGVSQPVETNPGGARPSANCMTGQLVGDLVGFRDENLLRRRDSHVRARRLFQLHAVAVGPADLETEFVFCLMTSICQAISCSSKL